MRARNGPRIPQTEFPPVPIPQELHDRVQGIDAGETFIPYLPPNSLEGNMTQRDPCLIEDHLAELQKILVVPEIAVAPARFFLI